MTLGEDRHTARSDQQSEDDQDDAEQDRAAHDLHDADDHEDHGDQPQQERHGDPVPFRSPDLTGFDPPFGAGEYCWGPEVFHQGTYWKDHAYHVEFLSWHYFDYLGTTVFAQVWDYSQQDHPDQRWQMVLLRHEPTDILEDGAIIKRDWAWVFVKEYDTPWGEGGPRHTEVGADIDQWLTEAVKR